MTEQKPLSNLSLPLRLGYTDGLFGTAGKATESADCTPTMGDVQQWWQQYQEGYEEGEATRIDYRPLVITIHRLTHEWPQVQQVYAYWMDDEAPENEDMRQLVRIRVASPSS